MQSEEVVSKGVPQSAVPAPRGAAPRRGRWPWLFGGGIDGNEQLTSMAAAVLLVLLAALGLTILRIGQLIWLHLFLGLLLVGPVALKMASTAHRFMRYYTRDALYVAKGPPMLALRAVGPVIVLTTLAVFATGVALLFQRPSHSGTLVLLHKASFILWIAFMAIHVLAHLPHMGRSLLAVRHGSGRSYDGISPSASGAAGRWIAVAGAIVAGGVLALVLLPHFGAWTAHGALPHEH